MGLGTPILSGLAGALGTFNEEQREKRKKKREQEASTLERSTKRQESLDLFEKLKQAGVGDRISSVTSEGFSLRGERQPSQMELLINLVSGTVPEVPTTRPKTTGTLGPGDVRQPLPEGLTTDIEDIFIPEDRRIREGGPVAIPREELAASQRTRGLGILDKLKELNIIRQPSAGGGGSPEVQNFLEKRKRAIQELESAGQDVTEANIEEVIRQLEALGG